MDGVGSDRRQRKRERMAGEILQAAARVFARRGFDGATVREIAEEADIAEGTIYNYFESKEDLLVQLPHLVQHPLLEIADSGELMARTVEANDDDEVVIKQMLQEGLQSIRQHVDIFKILLTSLPVATPEVQETYLRQIILQISGTLEMYLRRRIAEGRFRTMNPAIAARAWLGAFFTFILTQEVLPGRLVTPMDYDEVIDEVAHLLLFGVMARSEETNT